MNIPINSTSKGDLETICLLTKLAVESPDVKEWSYSGGYNASNVLLPLDKNKELLNILHKYTKVSKNEITSLHYINYPKGTSLQRHKDKEMLHIKNPPNSTTIIFLLSMCEAGGELFIDDSKVEFNKPGQYISFNGESLYHEVKEIKEGNRETLVVWCKPAPTGKAI